MISFGQLEARARTLYEAQTSTRWGTSAFLSAANDGLDELSEGTGFYERYGVLRTKTDQVYYDLRGFLPQDAFRINGVWHVENAYWLDPIGYLDLLTPRWETAPGAPRRYFIRGAFWLGIYPKAEGTLWIYYSGHAPHFKDQSSIVQSDLSDDFVPALEEYVMYDLSCKDGESDKALNYWASYVGREKKLDQAVKHRISTARAGRLGHGPGRQRQ